MADAMGCSLLASAVPLMAIILTKEHTESATNMDTRATRGTPCVTVPVLSNTMQRTWVEKKQKQDIYEFLSPFSNAYSRDGKAGGVFDSC